MGSDILFRLSTTRTTCPSTTGSMKISIPHLPAERHPPPGRRRRACWLPRLSYQPWVASQSHAVATLPTPSHDNPRDRSPWANRPACSGCVTGGRVPSAGHPPRAQRVYANLQFSSLSAPRPRLKGSSQHRAPPHTPPGGASGLASSEEILGQSLRRRGGQAISRRSQRAQDTKSFLLAEELLARRLEKPFGLEALADSGEQKKLKK